MITNKKLYTKVAEQFINGIGSCVAVDILFLLETNILFLIRIDFLDSVLLEMRTN